jgi:hypothetical protein
LILLQIKLKPVNLKYIAFGRVKMLHQIQKFLLLTASLAFSTIIFASSYPYVGIQGGVGKLDEGDGLEQATRNLYNTYSDITSRHELSISKDDLCGRAFIGWQLNPFVGFEMGYGYYPKKNYSASIDLIDNGTESFQVKVEETFADAVLKLSLPFQKVSPSLAGWHAYAKGGAAYAMTKFSGGTVNDITSTTLDQKSHAWRPTCGVGLGYSILDTLDIDLAWNMISGKNKVNANQLTAQNLTNLDMTKVIPASQMLTLTFTYNFIELLN